VIATSVKKSRIPKYISIYALGFSVVLLVLPWILKLDGHPHADWQQFLGRFHPLVVHVPIGLLLAVPLLELAGSYRPALREGAGFLLGLGFLGCVGAVTLGYLLAYGSGDAGAGVTRHMWGGIALTIGVLVALLVRPLWISGDLPRIYPVLLGCVLLVLAWAAHQGGSITHGSNYLTEYIPGPLKHWSMLGSKQTGTAVPDSFYQQQINPILDANCVSCHGEPKRKGGLRVDSYDLLMKGGKHGTVIVAGQPERSLLLQRVTLPEGHKLFMPAEGKPSLKPEQIALVRAWILQGASPDKTSLTGISIPRSKGIQPKPVGDYSGLLPEIKQLNMGQGAKLVPVSRNASDGLILNTVDVSSSFGDAQLASFSKFAPYIVEAELGRTKVTDASFATLARFSHLRALHLEGTAVMGQELSQLSSLPELTYLNLSGTKVTKAAIVPLGAMKSLKRTYFYDTPAQAAMSGPEMQSSARNTP
jgi:mono/diheme cytochrome c family protein